MAMSVPENQTRYECFYMAKLAERAQRYEETVNFMEKLVISSAELTVEERNLLFTASKKLIDSLRAASKATSLRTEQNEQNLLKNADDHAALLVTNYKSKIESDLSRLCTRILNLLDEHLIPAASESESRVFYLKMKGDYYRYLTEFKAGTEREKAAEKTVIAYKAAEEIAVAELDPTHPTRLGLALNFSVFCYEIEGASEKACSMAREAFEEAMASKLGSSGRSNSSYKDTALLIMQLLRDNLNLWASDMEINSYYH